MELVITLDAPADRRIELFGPADCNLRAIREALGVKIFARDSTLKLVGDADTITKTATLIESLQETLKQKGRLEQDAVANAIVSLAATPSGPQPSMNSSPYRKSSPPPPRIESLAP